MKKIIITILMLVSFIGYSSNKCLANIFDLGAIAGSNEYAEHNTNIVKQAIIGVNNKTYSGIYIPKGVWYINELSYLDGIDFRYVNWEGAGKRHSILKLANNRNKPIIEARMYFESHFRDIQFNGNRKNNPNLEYLMIFSSGNCYTIAMDNIYFRDYSGVALFLNSVTLFTLDNVDAKYGGIGGLKTFNCLGITTTNTDFEQNNEYAMLFESDFDSGKYRYMQPLIEVNNAYCESNGIGILLKGICNVSVNGIFNYAGIAAKITSNDQKTSYSHFNSFDGKHIGTIVIDKGNYGNNISVSSGSVIDLDGRNSNFLKGQVEKYHPAANLKIRNLKNHSVSYINDRIDIFSFSKNTAAFTYVYGNEKTKNLYLKLKGDLNSKISVRVYDLSLKKYYNFSTEELQENHRDYNSNFTFYCNGEIQYFKIPMNLAKFKKPRIQIKFSSKSDNKSICEFYGYYIN